MVRPEVIVLDAAAVGECKGNARAACLGGVSSVRRGDRLASLAVDQLVGQFGNAALSLYLTGGLDAYRRAREHANLNPTCGDGGSDLPGLAVDVKASLMRRSRDHAAYRLAVRPKERHAGVTYVLALVENPEWEGETFRTLSSARVALVGWATADMLGGEVERSGVFAGAYVLPARSLHRMMPVRWARSAEPAMI